MKKEIPRIFVNKISKVNNNDEVYYSYKDSKNKECDINPINMRNRIEELFRGKDFIYKKRFHIKTKYDEKDYVVISKSYDYLLCINGEKIYIDNILEIK